MLYVTPVYASLLALLFILLTVRVIKIRRELGIPLGDGRDPALQRAIGVQANFIEQVPLTLLLIAMAELNGLAAPWVHLLCLALCSGRALHAYGVSHIDEDYRFRVNGMALTFTALAASALVNLVL